MAVTVYTLDLASAVVAELERFGYCLVTGPHSHAFLLTDVLPVVAERLGIPVVHEDTPSGWVVSTVTENSR